MKKFIKKKNFKIFKTIDDNNLGSIARVILSSFIVVLFFYAVPIVINFTNNKILNTNEFQNNSKAVLAYTLKNQGNHSIP